MIVLKLLFHSFIFLVLTILTQVGGLVYLMVLYLRKKFGFNYIKISLSGLFTYLMLSLVILPQAARLFDRKALPWFGELRPRNYFTCLLNRHYVRPELYDVLKQSSSQMKEAYQAKVLYLDANFPFPGMPLIPHLSHSDGEKVDLTFVYSKSDRIVNTSPSIIGYGHFEYALEGEVNYPDLCSEKGFRQYNMLEGWVPKTQSGLELNTQATSFLISSLINQPSVGKVFIEPHLKERWGFASESKVRFHGCHAVRHDDHIHVQL